MAEPQASTATDRDLTSIAEARALAKRAKQAWLELAEFSQNQIDAVVDAMAAAATQQAEAFARLAVEETGYGVVEDKIQKNLFSSQKVYQFIKPMKTVGVIARHEERRVIEIAEPFGVVAAVVPSTNPTSTAIYKILISIKARCTIVLSPHPAAVKCITRVAEVMDEAARRAGAPAGCINWMTTVTLEGTQELMKQRDVAVILATGGMGLVRAAYSAGKPAYGVGPGNAPAFIERSANVKKAVHDIVTGKTFVFSDTSTTERKTLTRSRGPVSRPSSGGGIASPTVLTSPSAGAITMCCGGPPSSSSRSAAISAAPEVPPPDPTRRASRLSGTEAAPTANALMPLVFLLPCGSRAASACAVGSGTPAASETRTGAPTGAAISTDAAIAVRQSFASTRVTAAGCCEGVVDG